MSAMKTLESCIVVGDSSLLLALGVAALELAGCEPTKQSFRKCKDAHNTEMRCKETNGRLCQRAHHLSMVGKI